MSSKQISIWAENRRQTPILNLWIASPFIWSMIIPFIILDFFIEIYHRICFPLYGIPLVDRSRYIKIDRHRLNYLDGVSKIGCVYCGYVNGLLHYVSVIAATTELYWCPIQHEKDQNFKAPSHHLRFAKFGDANGLKLIFNQDRNPFLTEAKCQPNKNQSAAGFGQIKS